MEFENRRRGGLAALLAVASSSILVWFGNGLDPWWPLFWFAPLPVLLFALRSSWRPAALVAGVSWLIGNLNLWHYLRVMGAPPLAWAGIFSVVALVFAADVLLFRSFVRRGAVWTALLAFPAVWTAYEYLRNFATPHGTAGSIAYSQLGFLPFLQTASLAGPWGMSFLLLLFPAALAIFLHLRHINPGQGRRILGAGTSVLGMVLIFGAVRLAFPQPGPMVKVGLVTSDERPNARVAEAGPATERLFRDYAVQAERLSGQGARIIVLPEKLGVLAGDDRQNADAIFQSLANRTGSTIVAGLVHAYPTTKYNQARVYTPGAAPVSYNKFHLLPPVESMLTPGTTLTLLATPAGTAGVAICKDMDFTPLSRRYGQAGAGVMLVPAWDFDVDRAWHGHIALMRAVENGFGLVRAAKNGYLTVSDDRGRILAEIRSDAAPFAVLTAQVPAAHETTLYGILGDWFVWLAVAMFGFALLQFYRLRRVSA